MVVSAFKTHFATNDNDNDNDKDRGNKQPIWSRVCRWLKKHNNGL